MNWLSRYYDRRVSAAGSKGLLWQVGHTEGGAPISDEKFDTLLSRISGHLDLKPDESLLDLCCGNGVFTKELARQANRTLGMDFSSSLISVAQQECASKNLEYRVGNVKQLSESLEPDACFDKILMNAALQHFSPAEFQNLLHQLVAISPAQKLFAFTFVPDAAKRDAFNQKLNPGLGLKLRRAFGRDLVGAWYDRETVTAMCSELNLTAQFYDIDPAIKGGWYRQDIIIRS